MKLFTAIKIAKALGLNIAALELAICKDSKKYESDRINLGKRLIGVWH